MAPFSQPPLLTRLVRTTELSNVLRKIINEISGLEDSDSTKLAKYTRCLFQATVPFKEELGDVLLDEIGEMVRGAHKVSIYLSYLPPRVMSRKHR